jgi:hypothetical protein
MTPFETQQNFFDDDEPVSSENVAEYMRSLPEEMPQWEKRIYCLLGLPQAKAMRVEIVRKQPDWTMESLWQRMYRWLSKTRSLETIARTTRYRESPKGKVSTNSAVRELWIWYEWFLLTPHWREDIRPRALDYYGNACVWSGRTDDLVVHHRRPYEECVGREQMTDVAVYNREVHTEIHGLGLLSFALPENCPPQAEKVLREAGFWNNVLGGIRP